MRQKKYSTATGAVVSSNMAWAEDYQCDGLWVSSDTGDEGASVANTSHCAGVLGITLVFRVPFRSLPSVGSVTPQPNVQGFQWSPPQLHLSLIITEP